MREDKNDIDTSHEKLRRGIDEDKLSGFASKQHNITPCPLFLTREFKLYPQSNSAAQGDVDEEEADEEERRISLTLTHS